MTQRPRRNRKSAAIRNMIAETHVLPTQLIMPLFIVDEENAHVEVSSMPGQFRLGRQELFQKVEKLLSLGINKVDLFPAVRDELKDALGTYSYHDDNFYLKTIYALKSKFPELCIMTDVALDPYSSDGHDGVVIDGKIDNDITLPILAKMAVAQAQAGADIIGPIDMMDGRVFEIREALDDQGFIDVSIMSYTAKYASCFYGPFRDALDSAPKSGDKLSYQMNPSNRKEALLEAVLDEQEGADFLMVKPALAYLDIISDLKQNSLLPIAAYNVSGEYSMIKAASEKGWIDGERAMLEVLTSIKRAGADIILTYFAEEFATHYALNK